MPAQRILGQDVVVEIIRNSQPVETINTIKSFEFTYQIEIKSEGYLGETTNRKDSLFNGIKGRMELHLNSKKIFEFINEAVDKAKRRGVGTRINIKCTYKFPNGERARITIPDVSFGEFPIQSGSRTEYVSCSLDFEAAEARAVLT